MIGDIMFEQPVGTEAVAFEREGDQVQAITIADVRFTKSCRVEIADTLLFAAAWVIWVDIRIVRKSPICLRVFHTARAIVDPAHERTTCATNRRAAQ